MGWQDFSYSEVVHRIAAYLAPRPEQADVLGYLQDDYVSELCLEAILASRSFRAKHGLCFKTESRYVFKTLWNYARTKKRSRYRRSRFTYHQAEWLSDPVDMEERTEAKRSIEALQKNLDKSSLKVLVQLAGSGGNLTEAWEEDPFCHRNHFNSKVAQARARGKKLLQK